MGDIENKVQNLFRATEDLRVKAEQEKIRAETALKFLYALQRSSAEDNKPPYLHPKIGE